MLYGITHDVATGEPIIRLPKSTKVGIGMPKGKAIHVYIDQQSRWTIELGYAKDSVQTKRFDGRKDAEAFYRENWSKAQICPYPRKLAYFTFLKPTANSAEYAHDFDAIERHGSLPTAIDVIFMAPEPLETEFQMWSASQMRCHGDGLNAWRILEMAVTPEEKEAAAEARKRGEKYFKVLDACFCGGCKYSASTVANGKEQPAPCKVSVDLKFQLAGNIALGATSFYHSTGIKTASAMFSALETMRMLTGGTLQGIPATLVVKGFTSNHNGQAAKHFYVHPEFRAEDMQQVRDTFLRAALDMAMFSRKLAAATLSTNEETKQLAIAAVKEEWADDEDDSDEPSVAARMAAEFYPEADDDEPAAATQMEIKTAEKVEDLKAELKGEKPAGPSLAEKAAANRAKVEEVTAEPVVEKKKAPKASPFD